MPHRLAPHMCWNNKHTTSCGVYTVHNGEGGVVPVALKDYISGKLRRSLVVLWSAVGSILLIACVNLSNLLLARAATRQRSSRCARRSRRKPQPHRAPVAHRKPGPLHDRSRIRSRPGNCPAFTGSQHQGAIALPLLSTLHIDGAALAGRYSSPSSRQSLFGSFPACAWHRGNLAGDP